MNAVLRLVDEDAYSLPARIYSDPEFFELEKAAVFRTSWQIVCHESDIPRPGDFHTFEFLGESIVTLRGEDGRPRSFHNICRHRAARLLDGDKGHCGRRMLSPTTTLIREIAYVRPDERREMRAARYLNWRINRRVNLEDKTLIERVQAGMASSSYTVGPLSEGEVCRRSFGRRMRSLIPECRSRTQSARAALR